MLARDHARSGAPAFTAAAPVLHVTGAGLFAARCLLPARRPRPTSTSPAPRSPAPSGSSPTALSGVVHQLSGGHRKGTAQRRRCRGVHHCRLGGSPLRDDSGRKIILGLILGVLLAAGAGAADRRPSCRRIGLAAAAAAVCWHAGLALVPVCIALGAAAHIAGDELTHGGCPLAWPVSGHEFHLLPRRWRSPPAVRRALDHLHAAARRARLPAVAEHRDRRDGAPPEPWTGPGLMAVYAETRASPPGSAGSGPAGRTCSPTARTSCTPSRSPASSDRGFSPASRSAGSHRGCGTTTYRPMRARAIAAGVQPVGIREFREITGRRDGVTRQ